MESVSKSLEDYLEAIVMVGGTPGNSVRSVDVANKLNVSRASVNKAVGLLKDKGLLDQPFYGDLTLTEEGYSIGQHIFDRHILLSNFFVRELGIEPEQAEKEACLMEHAISDDSYNKWIAYIRKLRQMDAS